jgi:hypothetical protein
LSVGATVLTAGGVGLALLVKKAIGNGKNINIELGALVEQAQVVKDTSTVANGIASWRVGDLVAAGDRHVVTTSIVGLGHSDLLDGRVVSDIVGRGSSGHGGGEESDDGEVLHLEGIKLSKTKEY